MKKNILHIILFWFFSFGMPIFATESIAKFEIACTSPTSQPTNLTFANTFSDYTFASFTPTNADGYLSLLSTSASLTTLPVSGTNYGVGSALGNATVIAASNATSIPVYWLNSNTTYYIFVFSYNNLGCTTGTQYNISNPLVNSFTTELASSLLPSIQPTNLIFNPSTSTTISGSFTSSGNYSYLVIISPYSNLSASPVERSVYSIGSKIGNGTVVSSSTSNTFSVNGLTPNKTYYFYVFSYSNQSCNCGTLFRTQSPLIGTKSTTTIPCVTPTSQPTSLVFNTPTTTSVSGFFSPANANNYLIVYSLSSTLSAQPVSGTVYTSGNTIGNSTVVSVNNSTNFSATGLTVGTTYYFTVFSLNNVACSNGPLYNTTSPLKSSITIASTTLNYYFGNFHSHSEYSDGTGLPSGDFVYADAANCMDFLGISEHNHVSAGMSLSSWNLGRAQAQAARTPTFLALYGMEWGVISGGGHVIVYGVPNLLGWDAGQYDTFVAKNDYTGTAGLFSTLNNFGGNAFATLAHPNNSDYNGIMSVYNSQADNAIVGTAVENGPSTSTNTTYSDPPTSMSYLTFYRNMLARGYHLGPTIDHDNHNVTHGHTALSRTVVLATSLTENEILSSMRKMQFYASQDCSGYVNFKINNNTLGSIVSNAGAPNITVTASTSNPVTSLKIYSGVSGSGVNATILTSTTSGTINYTHTSLTNGSSRYYYIDITESDGKRIVTSPIWYTRNDTP
jgi:hypothetical protein